MYVIFEIITVIIYNFLAGHSSKSDDGDAPEFERGIKKINKQPHDNTGRNRYALQFFQETKEEIQKRREEARKTIELISISEQEVSDDYFPLTVDMPKRPSWDFKMSKDQLEMREQRYFTVRYFHLFYSYR